MRYNSPWLFKKIFYENIEGIVEETKLSFFDQLLKKLKY